MKILVVGSGARENAIGYSISKNQNVSEIFFAPGNPGCELIGKCIDINTTDLNGLLIFAKNNNIDYTIVGPEDPLCLGIVDLFESNNLKIFGVNKNAARLESSKLYAKDFMIKYNIPTALFKKVDNYNEAIKYSNIFIEKNGKVVLKADGLCQGKGVFIAENEAQASFFCHEVFIKKIFGNCSMLIEEFLDGFEMSYLCFVDNKNIVSLPTAKDHKKIFDAELGLNTGGMGTYSPNFYGDIYKNDIDKLVLKNFLNGINEEKLDFRGILFIGLIIGNFGIKVLEFNTRFGDPETQSILQTLDTDLLDIMMHTTKEKLSNINIKFNNKKVVSLVIASGGYPEKYSKNHIIKNLDQIHKDVKIFHAGTRKDYNGNILTNGGRVLTLTSATNSFEMSKKNVYLAADIINFKDKYYRKDIGPSVERIYVTKKDKFDFNSKLLLQQIKQELKIDIQDLNIYQRYDIENINNEELDIVVKTILSEAPVDNVYIKEEALLLQKKFNNSLVVEYHKGQFDQRKQGVLETIAVTLEKKDVFVACSKVYNFIGENITHKDLKKIENFLINFVDQKIGNLLTIPTTLKEQYNIKHENKFYENFISKNSNDLKEFLIQEKLSMSYEDILLVQKYFYKKGRNPSETELGIIDTYWSDHCRHTTFNTILNNINFKNPVNDLDHTIIETYNKYLSLNKENNINNISLMNLACIVAKDMKKNNKLNDLEISEENNACSIKIKVETKDRNDDYLLMFKNETHNHPTEIEPFGGASTCIGGAIRDPLSGRSYVYQSMRITGCADPRIENKIKGKLSQKKITIEAAKGYSSYGNQIGISTGFVNEIYHDGYRAKRMEVGAVVGAVPLNNIKREKPQNGDIILLIGGKTGRDGVGGATGSSKEHNSNSIDTASSEVQKGNAPIERKIQRLFRNKSVTKMIKKCNDFGAGGISVAIGELADSLEIYLDRVPLKYKGLSYKEITLSESQERMAVVISSGDYDIFKEYCDQENLEASLVAKVTNNDKLIIKYNNEIIVDLDRKFVDSSGAIKYQNIIVDNNNKINYFNKNKKINEIYDYISNINIASQKNLIEMFDSSIGKCSVYVPLGGANQLTPTQCMCSLIPSLVNIEDQNNTVSIMSYGFNPYLSEENEYLGSYYAVIESICKIAAVGGNPLNARLSFQEYFQKLDNDPIKWSKPFISLLGAFEITNALQLPVIGGKDSMSGTFEELHVPSTLISFAVTTENIDNIITPELKGDLKLGILKTKINTQNNMLDISSFKNNLFLLRKNIKNKNIKSCYAITHKGILVNLLEMSFGNDIGFNITYNDLYTSNYGSFIIEYFNDIDSVIYIGNSYKNNNTLTVNNEILNNNKLKEKYLSLNIFTKEVKTKNEFDIQKINVHNTNNKLDKSKKTVSIPKVTVPIFPGTNCEYDTIASFANEGAKCLPLVFNNLSIENIEKSILELADLIYNSQILVFPGGFSLGDEPDGSGKFIANVIRNPKIKLAIEHLLNNNDGLILGICNGFQALIKSGLLPYGKIGFLNHKSPTLTYNNNSRHIARMVRTKLVSKNSSPWLTLLNYNEEYIVPISHGEGRFICDNENYMKLIQNKQIAFEYIDNPNGSFNNIEGILSPCGKILGKMAHTERLNNNLYKNIPNIIPQLIIKSGVDYFKN